MSQNPTKLSADGHTSLTDAEGLVDIELVSSVRHSLNDDYNRFMTSFEDDEATVSVRVNSYLVGAVMHAMQICANTSGQCLTHVKEELHAIIDSISDKPGTVN